jgi:hypothetical protein
MKRDPLAQNPTVDFRLGGTRKDRQRNIRSFNAWDAAKADVKSKGDGKWELVVDGEILSRWTESAMPNHADHLSWLLRERELWLRDARGKLLQQAKAGRGAKTKDQPKRERILEASARLRRNRPDMPERDHAGAVHMTVRDTSVQYVRKVLREEKLKPR